MEDNVFELKDFTYYSRIVMMIILAVQFVLFIIFIVFIHDVKDLMDKVNNNVSHYFYNYDEDIYDISDIFHEQTQGIDACISFFIISFVVFLIEFIAHFGCDYKNYDWFFFNKVFNSWNHLLTLLSFIIAQFLYVIACLIIPIYLEVLLFLLWWFLLMANQLKKNIVNIICNNDLFFSVVDGIAGCLNSCFV